jgi:putative transposase
MVRFIDQHRAAYGVEPICRVVPIAPPTYFRCKAQISDPTTRSRRALRDDVLKAIIQRIWREHDQAYGVRKVWKQMGREGLREARCRVRRLMRELGRSAWSGAARGPRRRSPMWAGSVYVAFVIDVFARRIGWRVSSSLRSDFVLDALEQAIYTRCDDTVG